MKLVTRQQFLRMPKGTVFCKFPLSEDDHASGMTFGIERPCILNEVIYGFNGEPIDFWATELGFMYYGDSSESLFNKLYEMVDNLGMEVSFEHAQDRDGMIEDDNVGFAIFSREEVQQMIDLLQEALKTAY